MNDTLKLVVKKEWFDLMVTGEKTAEYRNPSEWMLSRLYHDKHLDPIDKKGNKKQFKYVQITLSVWCRLRYENALYILLCIVR